MPDELTIQVLKADFAADLMRGRCESHAEDAVEEGAVAAVRKEDEEGDEGGEGVSGCK